jgi:hypothetical protein
MFNPSLLRENIDAQVASTDGRATIYANGQTHMFERKVVIKKQRGGFKYKKNKTIYFFFSYPKRYSNTYTFLQDHIHSIGQLGNRGSHSIRRHWTHWKRLEGATSKDQDLGQSTVN